MGKRSESTYTDVAWITLKTAFAFALIRMFSSGIRLFSGEIPGAVWQAALFTFLIYRYVKGAAGKSGLSLGECYISRFKLTIRDIAFAFMIPVLFYLGMFLVSDGISPSGISRHDLALLSVSNFFVSSIGSGVNEEMVFRGYLLKSVEEKAGRKAAVIAASAVFGLGHALNGGMTPMEILWIVIGTGSLGVLFAVVTFETGNIWRAVLIHMILNSKERILGFDRSGSLFVFDFPASMSEEFIFCMMWGMMSAVSWGIIVLYRIRKRRENSFGIVNK